MKDLIDALHALDTLDGYRRYFWDAAYWRPVVQAVCRRDLSIPGQTVRSGLPGSFPTFIVDEQWVIKFYGRLFDGQACFNTEREVARLLANSSLPIAALRTSGCLDPHADWPWPFLVFAFVPGVSIGEVYEQVALDDRLAIARLVGQATRQLHSLPLDDSPLFCGGWQTYAAMLTRQRAGCAARHRGWGTWPTHLVEQIEPFLASVDELVPWHDRPQLIHADLTADHILGRLLDGRWSTTGIIDFGDAMVGSLWYELAALHLDLFRCDKRLLAAYLDAYGLDPALHPVFPRLAMSGVLLHQFDVLKIAMAYWPGARSIPTLDQFATALWDPTAPGLEDWTER